MVTSIWPKARVQVFGSFATGAGSPYFEAYSNSIIYEWCYCVQ